MTKRFRKVGFITIGVTILFIQCSYIKKEYYEDGSIKSMAHYNKQDSLDGELKTFYKSGKLESRQFYTNGIAHDTFYWYHENGNLATKVNYNEGKEEGLLESFYPSGALFQIVDYEKGKRTGAYKEYFESGKIRRNEFKVGDTVVFFEEYDMLGKLINDYRKINIEANKDTVLIGERYEAIISVLGPRNKLVEYEASRLVNKNEILNGGIKILGANLPSEEGKGKYVAVSDREGMFYYFGHAVVYKDSTKKEYRKYQFQSKVYVASTP